jgi:hypothetical protein|tara:strand:- start:358 stop:588 length:231 start_codon:yes stop_codon:yes gene_type:complete
MTEFTDEQRVEMIENQCEHIIELCASYVDADQLEDVGNIRALYEEYAEWLDTFTDAKGCDEEYTTAWCPNFLDCAS